MFRTGWSRIGFIVGIIWLAGCAALFFQVRTLDAEIADRNRTATQAPARTDTWTMLQEGRLDEIERRAVAENSARADRQIIGQIESKREGVAAWLYLLLALPIAVGIVTVLVRWVSSGFAAKP